MLAAAGVLGDGNKDRQRVRPSKVTIGIHELAQALHAYVPPPGNGPCGAMSCAPAATILSSFSWNRALTHVYNATAGHEKGTPYCAPQVRHRVRIISFQVIRTALIFLNFGSGSNGHNGEGQFSKQTKLLR